MYVCILTHTYMQTYMYMYACMLTFYVYVCNYKHIHNAYMYTDINVCLPTYIHTYIHTYICIHIFL